jgi:hypothetical protein
LSEAPILGGSPEQREAAAAALADFDRDVGPGRLTIGGVAFDAYDWDGGYSRWDADITLDPSLDAAEVPGVLRHELCHALDFAEDITRDEGAPWDRASEALFASGLVTHDPYGNDRLRRAEAFATFCGEGPYLAETLARSCPTDAPEAREIAEPLWEEVWLEAEPMPVAAPLTPAGAWTAALVPEALEIAATGQAGVVAIRALTPTAVSQASVELDSGEIVRADTVTHLDSAHPSDLPGDWPGAQAQASVGWDDGPAAAVDAIWAHHLGFQRRLLGYDGERWALVGDGCLPEVWSLFTAEDQPWVVWAEGSTVSWAPLAD